MITTLVASNQTERRLLDYLQANASASLTEKINTGKKTLAGALAYAKGEAQKLANGESSLCVDDATVFGWLIHFFEEDHIEEAAPKQRTVCVCGAYKPDATPQPEKPAAVEAAKKRAAAKAAKKRAAPVKAETQAEQPAQVEKPARPPKKRVAPGKPETPEQITMFDALFAGGAA
jgi:hypothetical protein